MAEDAYSPTEEALQRVEGRSSAQVFAVGVILASVYGVSTLLPMSGFIAAVGVTSTISFSICIAPLFGILLGPARGFAFGLVGGAVGSYFAVYIGGVPLAVPTVVLGPAMSGLFTGLCLGRTTTVRGLTVPGPIFAFLYLILIIVLYLIPDYAAWWFMAPYVLAAVLCLCLQAREVEFVPSAKRFALYVKLLPFTLIGTITDFSMMTMGAVYLLGLPATLFGYVIFPVMLVERTTATIVSCIIAAAVIVTFRGSWR